jgi:hypothetical protein
VTRFAYRSVEADGSRPLQALEGTIMKKTYAAPNVQDLGTVRDLTLGGQEGNALDATFQTDTPRGQLTFS